jgi:bla regulator protein BlaR1
MKTTISVLLLTIIMLTHSFEAKSQTNPKTQPPSWVGVSIGSTTKGVSQELMTEYSIIVSNYDTTDKEWWKNFEKTISTEDWNRLEQIFKQMSLEQQAMQKVAFIKAPSPLKKVVPSDKEFNSWKNSNVYGVWIDEKKVSNAVLNKYKSSDFDQVFVSKLYGVAKQNKKYSYQVDLMTKDYYRKYYEQSIAKGGSRLVFRA